MAPTIPELRRFSGLSQAAFARRFAIPRRTVESWEAAPDTPDHCECPAYTRQLLADALGFSGTANPAAPDAPYPITGEQFAVALSEAANYTDEDAFVSDLALSSIFPESADLMPIAASMRQLWIACRMSIRELRAHAGLTQAAFAARFGIPKRTVENWEASPDSPSARECPIYTRLLIADALGLMPEINV